MGVRDRFGRKATPMSEGNGNITSPSFGQRLQTIANAGAVPIIGLPFELNSWFIQILITCKCEAPKPVLIIGQPPAAMGQCPSCKKTYQLQTIGINPHTGQPHFQIAMVMAQPPPDPTTDHGAAG